MVYINDQYRFIFIENPKSGSTSILAALSRSLSIQPICRDLKKQNAHLTCKEVMELYPEKWNSYYKFTTYRDPLKRFLSSANYPRHQMLRGFKTFKDYHIHLLEVLAGKSKCQYCIPQSQFIEDIDFLIRTEHIQEDYSSFCKQVGIPTTIIEKNNSNSVKLFNTDLLTEVYNNILK